MTGAACDGADDFVGALVFIIDGAAALIDGATVGFLDGDTDGVLDGFLDGLCVGFLDGTEVGLLLGLTVGDDVVIGDRVGFALTGARVFRLLGILVRGGLVPFGTLEALGGDVAFSRDGGVTP